MKRTAIIFSALLLVSCQAGASPPASVQSIWIRSVWDGLSARPVTPERFRVTREGKHYVSKGNVLDTTRVERLVAAVLAPGVTKPNLASEHITAAWLDRHAHAAFASLNNAHVLPSQRRLFMHAFKDPAFVRTLVPEVSKPYTHTDDYPKIRIIIVTTEGQRIVADAFSQAPFMTPWTIQRGEKKIQTWTTDIGRALGMLLPKGFLNKERLSTQSLTDTLAQVVMEHIQTRWDILRAEHAAHGLISSLRKRYRLEEAEVTPAYNDDFESAKDFSRDDPNLFTTLSRPGDPDNLKIFFTALHSGKMATAPDADKVAFYMRNVLQAPWIMKALAAHHQWQAGIRMFQGRSFNAPGMKQFAADMREIGRPELIPRVKREADKITLLISGRARWLVFPDHSAILWRALSFEPQGWLIIDRHARPENDCDDVYECPAIVVSPQGRVIQRKGVQNAH